MQSLSIMSRRSSPASRERGVSYWTKNYRTGLELSDPHVRLACGAGAALPSLLVGAWSLR
ncbi:hypothetical protein [Actinomadura geliboluensis]|uniref:hypothetical protein n=1 Tax=Actinomadura geliboluensis TaxID=882440 RepID=UPI0036BDFEC8